MLGLLGVDIHEGMDVVERVHEEVRVDLVAQVFELVLEVLLLQLCHLLLVVALLEVELDAEVHAEHQEQDDARDDVVLADDDWRHLVVHVFGGFGLPFRQGPWGWGSLFAVGRHVWGLHIGLHAVFHWLHVPCLMPHFFGFMLHLFGLGLHPFYLWPHGALPYGEAACYDGHEGYVGPAAPAIDEQRCHEEVMEQEGNEEDEQLAPYVEHLGPAEEELRIGCGAYV